MIKVELDAYHHQSGSKHWSVVTIDNGETQVVVRSYGSNHRAGVQGTITDCFSPENAKATARDFAQKKIHRADKNGYYYAHSGHDVALCENANELANWLVDHLPGNGVERATYLVKLIGIFNTSGAAVNITPSKTAEQREKEKEDNAKHYDDNDMWGMFA